MRGLRGVLTALLVTVGLAGLTACGGPPAPRAERPAGDGPVAIEVPRNAETINAALGVARSGDMVLVAPGRYTETVAVRTPGVTLRGADRNGVVVDGEGRRANGIVVTAPGVVVENITTTRNLLNGLLVTGMSDPTGTGIARGSDGYERLDLQKFPPLDGFRVSGVTASNNGLYGIYAFHTQRGVIEGSYASGSADSGIYVGQCKPCDTVVRGNIAERNAVGYEAANASGGITVLGNRWSGNRVGMTSNSEYQEALIPQTGAVFAGNLISGNAEPTSPAQAEGAFGIGIGIAGGQDNLLVRNRVVGNPTAGVVLASTEDIPPDGNRFVDNVVTGGPGFVYAASSRAPGRGNCATGGTTQGALPPGIAGACPGPAARTAGGRAPGPAAPEGVSFREVPAPPQQPSMPGAATAAWGPAQGLPGPVDVDRVPLPDPGLLAATSGSAR